MLHCNSACVEGERNGGGTAGCVDGGIRLHIGWPGHLNIDS